MIKDKGKPSLSGRAYQRIKDSLCSRQTASGDILSESQLAEEMKWSQNNYSRRA